MRPSWPAGSWGWQLTLLDTNCKWRAAKPTTTARLRRDEMHGTTGLLSAARGAPRWTELRRFAMVGGDHGGIRARAPVYVPGDTVGNRIPPGLAASPWPPVFCSAPV